MASLSLRHIYKIYPPRLGKKRLLKKKEKEEGKPIDPNLPAVADFNMEIQDGEFIVFVGPSGCGKSTTLRMIAGLEEITAGELYIDGELMNNVDPMHRDIAMVFQNYALYPHMSVFDNIAFGLKMRKIPTEWTRKDGTTYTAMRHMKKEDIAARVHWAAKILGIENLLDRKPTEMSGGQCQRVALGRAIVRGPKVFLFDEPLSNLDAKLRTSMRGEIVKLHHALKTTFIYVTHDQVEAMTMGTRIVVMKDGVVQQIDTPSNLFHHPVNEFVAGFLGTPQMNFLNVDIAKENEGLRITLANGDSFVVPMEELPKLDPSLLDEKPHPVTLGVRGEHIRLGKDLPLHASVSFVEVLGSTSQVFVKIPGYEKEHVAVVNEEISLPIEAPITFDFVTSHLHFFDKKTKESLVVSHSSKEKSE